MRLKRKSSYAKELIPFKNVLGISRFSSVGEFIDIDVKVVNCVRTKIEDAQISLTQGISRTIKGALGGALLESVERYCLAEMHKNVKKIPVQFCGSKLPVPPHELGYEYDPSDVRMLPVKQILNQRSWYIPAAEIVFPYNFYSEPRLINPYSSGVACGANSIEASLYGVLEVVERFYTSELRWDGRGKVGGYIVDLSSLPCGEGREMISTLLGSGYKLFVLKVDSIFPTYVVVAYDDCNLGPKFIVSGASTSFTNEEALKGAVYQVIQDLVVSVQSSREDLWRHREQYNNPCSLTDFFTFYRKVSKAFGIRCYSSLDDCELSKVSQPRALDIVVQKLRTYGFQKVYCCDLSIDVFPVSVVKVIIPGLYDALVNPQRVCNEFLS